MRKLLHHMASILISSLLVFNLNLKKKIMIVYTAWTRNHCCYPSPPSCILLFISIFWHLSNCLLKKKKKKIHISLSHPHFFFEFIENVLFRLWSSKTSCSSLVVSERPLLPQQHKQQSREERTGEAGRPSSL